MSVGPAGSGRHGSLDDSDHFQRAKDQASASVHDAGEAVEEASTSAARRRVPFHHFNTKQAAKRPMSLARQQ